ncbi:uncharacterized protein BX664DRAFT_376668 [Halteromyces radiatus]|uniref:uncharacterized protein n=1 Tax=Halteromyces radiatus TaxID=101107 RepID=UPI00221E9D2B|nr:uncharacterized protein BX664DRAFT_376668 [Halteromyces radiatus]KAI8079906.1 hypothetical protein BX664DRAFT_376668 [Halteromyces radiatus]
MYRLVLIWVVLFFTWCSAQSNKPCPLNTLKEYKESKSFLSGILQIISPICDNNHQLVTCKNKLIDETCNTHIKNCDNPNWHTALCLDQVCYCGNSTDPYLASILPKTCTNASECPKCSGNRVKACKNKKCGCDYPPAKPPAPSSSAFSSSCAKLHESCSQKGCCDGYCHQRTFNDHPTCEVVAFNTEDCSSGIHCQDTSQCIRGRCSLQFHSDCDFDGAVCPYGSHCGPVNVFVTGTNRRCECDHSWVDGKCYIGKQCDLDFFGVKELCQCRPGIGDYCYAGTGTSEKCKEACYAHRPACKTTYTVNLAGLQACRTFEPGTCKNYYMNWSNKTIEITDSLARRLTECGHKI